MGLLTSAKNKLKRMIAGYEGVAFSKRRKATPVDRRSEDRVLNHIDRDTMISAVRDMVRNDPVVASAVRKHVNYVARFKFQCNGTNDAINTQAEALMKWWFRPLNCDASGRHSFAQLTELVEQLAVTEGDVFTLKLVDGRIQIIEGDRVRTPTDMGDWTGVFTADQFVHGINVDSKTAAMRVAICERVESDFAGGGFKVKFIADSGDILQHGYFQRYDQIRGITPLAASVNDFKDLRESKGYALAKMKVSQFAAMARTTLDDGTSEDEAPIAHGPITGVGPVIEPNVSSNGGDGPKVYELLQGEKVEMIESAQPSTQFQQYSVTVKMDALKGLDQPYSFHDEKWTNYSGARNALQQYNQLADSKRDRLRNWLNALTAWRIQMFIDDGELTVPDGFRLDDLNWEWVDQGMPWIDPTKEANADIMLIAAGLKSREDTCRARGDDWYAVQDKLKAEQDYSAQIGLVVSQPSTDAGTTAPTNEQLDQADATQGEDDDIAEAA